MKKYVGAIDQGTTSSRFIVFDKSGTIVSAAQKEHRQIYPKPGWVEHDPREILAHTNEVIGAALARADLSADDLAAVGITNQRETTLLWDAKTGQPLHNALVWQDTRVDRLVAEYAREGGQDRFREKTGLPLASYFSGLKLHWLLREVPGARAKAEAGEVLFGTIDSWLAWNLTGGAHGGVHITDVTNASRTQLMNLASCEWDPEMLAAFEIPSACLPRIVPSSAVYAEIAMAALKGAKLAGILGDQQAALVGQTCFAPGEAKNTYGTGNFLLMNTGAVPVQSKAGLLTTLAYRFGEEAACVRARGRDRDHRGAGAMAARQPQAHRRGIRDRAACPQRRGQWRCLYRPRLLRTLRALLEGERARRDRGPHAIRHPRPSRPRRARGDRVSDARRRRSDGGG